MLCPPIIPTVRSLESRDLYSTEYKDIYYKHPTECDLFIDCDKGNMTILECPNNTHFSPIYQSCVHPSISNCNNTFSIKTSPLNTFTTGHENQSAITKPKRNNEETTLKEQNSTNHSVTITVTPTVLTSKSNVSVNATTMYANITSTINDKSTQI